MNIRLVRFNEAEQNLFFWVLSNSCHMLQPLSDFNAFKCLIQILAVLTTQFLNIMFSSGQIQWYSFLKSKLTPSHIHHTEEGDPHGLTDHTLRMLCLPLPLPGLPPLAASAATLHWSAQWKWSWKRYLIAVISQQFWIAHIYNHFTNLNFSVHPCLSGTIPISLLKVHTRMQCIRTQAQCVCVHACMFQCICEYVWILCCQGFC